MFQLLELLFLNNKKYMPISIFHPNVTIEVKDYRYLTGKFDRVYSVGTFEHIGVKNYPTYFNKCYQLLNDDGIMIIHTIGTSQHHLDNQMNGLKNIFFQKDNTLYINIINYKNIDKWNLEDMQNFGVIR